MYKAKYTGRVAPDYRLVAIAAGPSSHTRSSCRKSGSPSKTSLGPSPGKLSRNYGSRQITPQDFVIDLGSATAAT